jgi:hypothetical protein
MASSVCTNQSSIERALDHGAGVLRLAPNWVPRAFCVPGRRIKLHPDDYYALGGARGGIDERWFSSAIRADNGPLTGPDEGLSFIVGPDDERIPLDAAVAALGAVLIGERLWREYGKWPIYSKFFDNLAALPFHIHHRDEHAALVGQSGKPEAYYFPPQLNNYGGDFPHTFFGLRPGTTREQVRACLASFAKGDNHITELSQAYRLRPGTGWDVPAGVLHAPGSLCTYEPQRDSDVFGMFESLTGNQVIAEDLLWKDAPADRRGDLDLAVSWIDWDTNVDPDFASRRFMAPKPARDLAEMQAAGYVEQWIVYKSPAVSAKELTVLPGRTVTVRDAAAYGLIVVQGHGTLNNRPVETPALIRYGQLTNDEYFVAESAARAGVTLTNPSKYDPLVMLKHFGPGNPDLHLGS